MVYSQVQLMKHTASYLLNKTDSFFNVINKNNATDHDKKYIPDVEARPSWGAAWRRKGRMFKLGVLVDLWRHPFPRFDVAVQCPLLLVNEGLDIDARDLAAVFFEF